MAEKKTKIVARGKYALVRQDEPESRKTSSGLYVPDSEEREQKAQGIIESVGSKIDDLKKGQKVIFGAFAGEKMKIKEGSKDVDFVLLHDDDIIAFVE